jgi:hypothetical protein
MNLDDKSLAESTTPQVSETEEVSERKAICGQIMHPSAQKPLGRKERRMLGLKRIRCTEDLGHPGNHRARTKNTSYEWAGQEKRRAGK